VRAEKTLPVPTESPRYLRYWAKTDRDAEAAYHPVAFHGLDVAACGAELLRAQPRAETQLSAASGIEAGEPLRAWVGFLLASHDLGKLADGFQRLRPDLMLRLQERSSEVGYDEPHDLLGYRLWRRKILPMLGASGMVPGDAPDLDWLEVLDPWLRAVCGHHGRPPLQTGHGADLRRQFPAAVETDLLALVADYARLLLPGGLPFSAEASREEVARSCRAAWLMAGVAVAADWIGSNAEWFPLHPGPMPLPEYWTSLAVPRAREAVAASGLVAAPVAPARGLAGIWPGYEAPTPLQAWAERVELASGPQLVVVEEVTGGGKTEAALILAHRMMERGQASGLFVALPTMATANAMFERVQAVYGRLFAHGPRPSIVLAHSKSHLDLRLEETKVDDPNGGEQPPTASRQCAAWLSDSRKKALLAHVGVGTIDQALMAVLPLNHQSLRLWGVAGKILIVDEVHACDEYVRGLLGALLRFHAALGGSAVLLSATLPAGQRKELLEVFADGAGLAAPKPRASEYPLVTHLAADVFKETPVAAREEASRRIEVVLLRDEEAVDAFMAAGLERGECACWVRNTVDDALRAYERWVGRLGADMVTLFHSRFTVEDRARIEAEVLRRFGPDSTAEDRGGRLLIATQVVEQSLDLDFDRMVTDLAPGDLVIQRVGRERRHRRDAHGNRLTDPAAPDHRGPVVLGVLTPDPVTDPSAGWYSSMFPKAAHVYTRHSRLWLTARWLQEHGGFSMPEDARDWIEFVYGEESGELVSAGLREADLRGLNEEGRARSLALTRVLRVEQGYRAGDTSWEDDDHPPTRLGEPTVTLRLVRSDNGRLTPWHGEGRYPWERSSLQVRRSLVSGEAPDLPAEQRRALDALKKTMPDQGRYSVAVVMTEEEGVWRGAAENLRAQPVTMNYSSRFGFQRIV
jgi:CRISPR-associated endonuclease/helicase Cas3